MTKPYASYSQKAREISSVWLVGCGQIFWQAILAFRNPPTADKIGFELGLFFWAGKLFHFHNPL